MATSEEAVMSAFNDEIFTMRKKIQLSEGQRKAQYEEFDAEKRKITSEIRALKKEIRELNSNKPSQFVDLKLLKTSGKSMKELKAFEGKTPEEVFASLDLQCIDLQKKLDLTKYEIGKKKERYAASLKEMNELAEENDIETIMPLNGNDGKLIKLENKIHEAGLHLLEMRHLERKYTKMRQSLLDDRVFFQNTLDKYEEEIAKQAKEIEHLQSVRDEAVRLRDKTRRKLTKLEAQVVAEGVERDQQLQELKKRVDEGRAYLERVQRGLVPTNKALPHHDSGEVEENGATAEQQAREDLLAKMQKLKEVTGAKDEEDILQKLKTQKLTKERLLNLKACVENEKKKLELKREQLEAELEAVKFSQVKEKEQNEEEYEMHEKALKEAMDELEEARKKHKKEQLSLLQLKEEIQNMCDSVQGLKRKEKLPDSDEDVFGEEEVDTYLEDLINLAKSKFNEMITAYKDLDLQGAVKEPLSDLFLLEESQGSKRPEGSEKEDKTAEDAPDVPSREYLKRQSQLMVETQGKRKGYPKECIPSCR